MDFLISISQSNLEYLDRQSQELSLEWINVSKKRFLRAKTNRIEVENVDSKKGILFGTSVPLKANAIIFVSAKHRMQVWYEHEGECGSCERYKECIELLWDFAEEMKLKLQSTEDPTKIADELFRKLKEVIVHT